MDGELNVWMSVGAVGVDVSKVDLMNSYYHSPEYIKVALDIADDVSPDRSFDLLNNNNNNNNEKEEWRKKMVGDDVYGIGIFMYELLAHRIPFSRLFQSAGGGGGSGGSGSGREMIINFGKEVESGRIRPTFPPDIDRSLLPLVQLCSSCWTSPPSSRISIAEIIKEITSTYAAIVFESSHTSRSFWISSFPSSLTASVYKITDRIYKYVKIDEINREDLDFLSLQAALANLFSLPLNDHGEKQMVKMRDMVAALEYIGPITRQMISATSSLVQKTWFHGLLGREEAEVKIKDQPVGSFLFRWSKSEAGCYSLTVKNNQEIKHFRIAHSLGSPFTLGLLPLPPSLFIL